MKKISRLFLFGALILGLLTAACAAEEGTTPTLPGTSFPDEATSTPLEAVTETTGTAETQTATTAETATLSAADGTATTAGTVTAGGTRTPGIPVTGVDIVLVECQFCVDTTAHALLVLPDTATFQITSPTPNTTTSTTSVAVTDPSCTTVEVNHGKQVVLCSGPEMTPLTLNICTETTTCTDFPVDLLACPLAAQPTAAPANTQQSTQQPANTPATGAGTATSTAEVIISTATP
jgi:hypothetical protein